MSRFASNTVSVPLFWSSPAEHSRAWRSRRLSSRGKVAASPSIADVIWVVTIFPLDLHLNRVQSGQRLSVDEPLRAVHSVLWIPRRSSWPSRSCCNAGEVKLSSSVRTASISEIQPIRVALGQTWPRKRKRQRKRQRERQREREKEREKEKEKERKREREREREREKERERKREREKERKREREKERKREREREKESLSSPHITMSTRNHHNNHKELAL